MKPCSRSQGVTVLLPYIVSFLCLECSSAFLATQNARPTTSLSSVPSFLDTTTSGFASILRLPAGTTVSTTTTPSTTTLKTLFDVENDPACRRVREKITELDLCVRIVPATPNSRAVQDPNYEYRLPSGMTDAPILVAQTAESGEVVISGDENILSFLNAEFPTDDTNEVVAVDDIRGTLASLLRFGRGEMVCKAAKGAPRPTKPLILYSYDGNQFCRLVREVLTELDIVYDLKSAGKLSPRRQELAELTGGRTQCPYLIDPNTDTAMFESADIIKYLYKTYAKCKPSIRDPNTLPLFNSQAPGTPPNESLAFLSEKILPPLKPLFSNLAPLQAGSSTKNMDEYKADIERAAREIKRLTSEIPVVVYTFKFSPYSIEAKNILTNLGVKFTEKQIGLTPLLMNEEEAVTRAALFELTGKSSMPSIWIQGKPIGGLYDGTPGLIPLLEYDDFPSALKEIGKAKVI